MEAGKTKSNCFYESTQVHCSIMYLNLEIEAELGLEVFNGLQVLSYSGEIEDGTTHGQRQQAGAREGKTKGGNRRVSVVILIEERQE